ncbi:type II toxin-antitoxin system RelE/ParE family toxin [Plebeiibacterium sediminum]|uniref:Type II toxin-antitoxin system RelE/ParE family toxin n=1 Tax=Plebeiibacterium sediminum TaxID=2992112 RepID=A0AAE3SFX4_9BACT|nr:type II toxin-antitoxin system RelE/ParE family toxin [Plebeiobacterium sediminum]MCW3787741.1 type II toxin-antitoxin system RelE/ParE family toxin [Plebeiobacterium sediminum]
MKIVFKESFVSRLEHQVDFIALDSPSRARKFKNELISKLKGISKNPNLCRKSIYFEDANIRDFIFKGYTIVFRINNEVIEVFGFVKYQEKPLL